MTCEIPNDDYLHWEPERMTAHGESQTESRRLRMSHKPSLTTPKDMLKIGCWNVRTMYQVGKTANIMKEFRKYNLNIMGISEMRWTGFGELRTATGETILYSGAEEEHHRGVGIVLNRTGRSSLLKWNPVSDRIISARFFSRFVKLTVIQIYSPTNDADETEKDTFYEQLQKEIETVPQHDILVVMGDANAKVGNSNDGWERIMGKEGLGTMNENGMRLAEMCALNNLVVGGTLFKHQNIHKYTWESPNGRDKNQIDHVLVNSRYRRSLLDVRTMRGADANSDHHLVMAKIRLKLCRNMKQIQSQRKAYNITKLKDPQICKSFQLELRNRFQQLSTQETTIDEQWVKMRDIYNESADKLLGARKREHKDWISTETYRAIDERRKIKEEIARTTSERIKEVKREQYKVKDKEVKRRARGDKRKRLDDIACEAEDAANGNRLSDLYRLTRELSNKRKSRGAV